MAVSAVLPAWFIARGGNGFGVLTAANLALGFGPEVGNLGTDFDEFGNIDIGLG